MKRFTMFAMLLVIASLVLAACAPAATPATHSHTHPGAYRHP